LKTKLFIEYRKGVNGGKTLQKPAQKSTAPQKSDGISKKDFHVISLA
jgi:hypothetical protein